MSELLPFLLPMPALIVVSAIASGTETAIFSLSRRDRDALRSSSPSASSAVEIMLATPSRLLIFVLLVNMVTNIAYFVLGAVAATRAPDAIMATAISVGSVLAIIIFGEVFAKLLARSLRLQYCRLCAKIVLSMQRLAIPLIVLIDVGALRPAQRLLGGGGAEIGSTAVDLATLVLQSAKRGDVTAEEEKLLRGVISLGAARAEDVMTPRVDVSWVRRGAKREVIAEAVRNAQGADVIVCDDSAELRVVGLLDVAAMLDDGGGVKRHTRPALFVPELATLDQVFAEMRTASVAQAVCVNEYGDFVGVIRPEDVADELLEGLAQSEAGSGQPLRLVRLGVWSASGSTPLRDLVALLGDEAAPSRSCRTLGGLIHAFLGRVPREGDRVQLSSAVIEVAGVEGGRVTSVMIRLADTGATLSGIEVGRD